MGYNKGGENQRRNSVWSTCCMRGSNLHARMQICKRAKSACMHGRAIGLAAACGFSRLNSRQMSATADMSAMSAP
eukprot:scaffold12387_cov63-Cyclotella_meneghiniana.AAC.4